jgi:serine-type D-Ala-D-Ala carboxypeptidase/endopeptidase
VEAYVERHLGPVVGKIPGITVAVVKDGDEQVFGLGSMASRQRPRNDCWEIGSITKAVTGTLLAEMSLRGEVGLDDAIGLHLPAEVAERLPDIAAQPTLEDLATHHAGLPSVPLAWYVKVARSDDPYARLSEAQVFDRLGPKTERPRKPTFRYSNLGMGLLGHILERVGGQPYAALVRERLLDPLGLDHTGVGTCGGGEAVQGFRKGKPTPAWTFGALGACGALRSTITDMASLARSAMEPSSGRVGNALRLATEPRRDGSDRDMQVGLGWMIRTVDSRDLIWHNGGTFGASTFLAVDRERATAVVALGNAGPRFIPRLDGPCWALLDEISRS